MKNKSIGAAAFILDDAGRVLLVKHTYGALNWELPGGGAEVDESPMDTALREVREETGLTAIVQHMTGIYYDANADFLHFVFRCRLPDPGAAPQADRHEISECRFWPPDALPRPISDFTIKRIEDALTGVELPLPHNIAPRVWLT